VREMAIFSYFDTFINNILQMNSGKNIFKYGPFQSRSAFGVIFNSHAKPPGTTHFHVDIGCHVNPAGSTTLFSTQNKSHHFDWRDSNMSHTTSLGVTYFESKLANLFFLLFNIFLKLKLYSYLTPKFITLFRHVGWNLEKRSSGYSPFEN
jgi:hypothetical protein